MQLNSKLFRGIRSARAFWVSTIAAILGVVFVVLGVYFFIADKNKTFETATATVLEHKTETIGEETTDYVTIEFTDKNGELHTNVRLDAYKSSWSTGKQIKIYYNVDDPTEVKITKSKILLPIIFVGLGSVCAIAGVVGFVVTVRQVKRKPKTNADGTVSANDMPEDVLSDVKLFFRYCGKMNQSYRVEDKQGNVVFECNLLKFNPLGSNLYEFTDTKTGAKKQLKIGKTFTASSESDLISVGEVTSSSFKIDGVNCWDYVADRGYEIKHLLEGKQIMRYNVVKGENTVASIVPANIKDPFNEDSVNLLRMGSGCYRLEIANANLPDIVTFAFIVSRTDIVE